jgi:hypothetical protein
MAQFNTFQFNKKQFNADATESFFTEIEKLLDTKPRFKIEFIDTSGVATDISEYYEAGGEVERVKERAPDEIQAGDFDIVLKNHDDNFSEYKAGGLLFGIQYHGARIRVWAGFQLSDGSVVYKIQQVGYIDELIAHDDESKVTFRCRDLMRSVLDQKMHNRPASEVPVAGTSNVGDGTCSAIATKPFKTVDEDWTLTCTTPGADGVAQFSVVGSVSGNVGTATSGTEFSTGNGVGGVKFTLTSGLLVDWAAGDSFTFSTRQYPEWQSVNPVKILWAVLTGHNFDTGSEEAWSDMVIGLDSTLSSDNPELDYDSFVTAAAQFGAADALTGYVAYAEECTDFLQSILLIFLGALYTNGDGRIKIQSFQPVYLGGAREYADDKKIMKLGYNRAVSEIINNVTVHYKGKDSWEFSDQDVDYDAVYSAQDANSIVRYKSVYPFEESLKWFTPSGVHAQDFANRLIVKYKDPPLVIDFETGADGIIAQIGDRIEVTDDKYGFDRLNCEVSAITKKFDSSPVTVAIKARRDGDLDLQYGYLGSRVDEGDGISPQADTFAAATDSDKTFCYLTDDYRMF